MITEEKFYEKVSKFALLEEILMISTLHLKEYEKLIKENQTDKNKTLIYLYSTNKTDQYSYIEKAKKQRI